MARLGKAGTHLDSEVILLKTEPIYNCVSWMVGMMDEGRLCGIAAHDRATPERIGLLRGTLRRPLPPVRQPFC